MREIISLFFGGGLDTGGIVAVNARLTIDPNYQFTRSEQPRQKKISVVSSQLLNIDTAPRLVATLQNETTQTFRNVPVTVAISDKNGPVVASQTIIDLLPPRGTREVVFIAKATSIRGRG